MARSNTETAHSHCQGTFRARNIDSFTQSFGKPEYSLFIRTPPTRLCEQSPRTVCMHAGRILEGDKILTRQSFRALSCYYYLKITQSGLARNEVDSFPLLQVKQKPSSLIEDEFVDQTIYLIFAPRRLTPANKPSQAPISTSHQT